ncbi:MAG: hypothetical protein ABIW49_01970 [Knoellia sp.]
MGRHPLRRRAVVLGASMSGLLAARVLSDHYDEVVVIDRDDLPTSPGHRRGTPHSRHAHGLMAKGQQVVEGFFPGITAEIEAHGVHTGDFNSDMQWFVDGRRLRPSTSNLLCVPATRPVLEHVVRKAVRALGPVQIRERTTAIVPLLDAEQQRCVGVLLAPTEPGLPPERLDADLVVDASGRGSRTPVWLAEWGYAPPPTESIEIDLAYVTRHYRSDSDPFDGGVGILTAPSASCPRGAVLGNLPGPGRLLELSVTGMVGDHPPTDPEGFTEFVRSLSVPAFYEAIRTAEPVSDPVKFTFPRSQRHLYEALDRFPRSLLVLGDARCSFNPIYAQGMSSAALQAVELDRWLSTENPDPDPRAFFAGTAPLVGEAWEFSAAADTALPGVEGPRGVRTKLINSYSRTFARAATVDSRLTDAFVRVAGMVDSPRQLMSPRNIALIARTNMTTMGEAR